MKITKLRHNNIISAEIRSHSTGRLPIRRQPFAASILKWLVKFDSAIINISNLLELVELKFLRREAETIWIESPKLNSTLSCSVQEVSDYVNQTSSPQDLGIWEVSGGDVNGNESREGLSFLLNLIKPTARRTFNIY